MLICVSQEISEMRDESDKKDDVLNLLKQVYPCISSAISLELEHGNYEEIEKLKILRREIEKLIT